MKDELIEKIKESPLFKGCDFYDLSGFLANWGWDDRRNGYYFCKVFNTRLGGEIPDDGDNTYIESLYDFRYDFKYAIVAN